jgi:hypothetical protein
VLPPPATGVVAPGTPLLGETPGYRGTRITAKAAKNAKAAKGFSIPLAFLAFLAFLAVKPGCSCEAASAAAIALTRWRRCCRA